MKPLVAIVGRPNVGKSTLFNRWVGRRLAIVHDAPGVTRDRHYYDAYLQGRELTLVDTGGLDLDSDDPLGQGVARQVRAAVEEADVVLCLLDGGSAPLQSDQDTVELLRKSGKPVLYAANKLDNPKLSDAALDLYRLGIDELHLVSALHGVGLAALESAVVRALPVQEHEQNAGRSASAIPQVALIGRPNAGKSSLLNRLVGEERALVDTLPGTTRDPLDTLVTFEGRELLVIDTAGIRRRARVERGVEAASVLRSIRTAERADVTVVVCDVEQGLAEQDARLLSLSAERGTGVVVAANKMDLLDKPAWEPALERARSTLHFAPFVPLVPLSAKTGRGVRELMAAVFSVAEQLKRRVPTAELNRFFKEVLERRPPPTRGGRAPRIYYLTQAQSNPPLFVAMSSSPQRIPESYRRYVANQIRRAFGFDSIPIRVQYRPRRQRDK